MKLLAAGSLGIGASSFARASHAQGAPSFDALLAELRALPGLRADFHEEKRVALLRRPIATDGTLHFAPPARFARHVRGATWSSIVVDGSRVVLATASERRELSVAHTGSARPFLEGFIGLLSGDRAALERAFECTFTHGEPWRLELRPRVAGPIASLSVTGHGVRLEGYRLREGSGDETVVTLSNVDVHHAYSAAEARRTFRPVGP